jgi:predicted dinucleotide-binding enzyme
MGQSDGNSVGIIGAGRLGQAMARTARRAGRDVVIANSRGPESLASVVSELGDGVSAGTPADAAAAGIVVIAVPWDRVPEAVQGLTWNGQIVIDATNDWAAGDLQGGHRASSSPTSLPAGGSSRPPTRSAPTCSARAQTRPAAGA